MKEEIMEEEKHKERRRRNKRIKGKKNGNTLDLNGLTQVVHLCT
jgi:hypothetical protein